MKTIAVYGDSITRGVYYDVDRQRYSYLRDGFNQLLSDRGVLEIKNHSRFGATAEEGLQAYQKDPELQSRHVAIAFGGNDCTPNWQAASDDPQGYYPARTSLAGFEGVLRCFVTKVRANGQIPILVTPPPLVAERYVDWISQGLNRENILHYIGDVHHVYRWQEQYALAVHQAARRTQCYLFDMRAWFLRKKELASLYCVDGMHPNQLGHQWMARAVELMLPSLLLPITDIAPGPENEGSRVE